MTAIPSDVPPVLAALGDPTRRQLLDLLVEAGQATATTLAGRLPVSRQAVVKHLRVLEAAGLICGVRAGREVRFAAVPRSLEGSVRWLAELSASWEPRSTATGTPGQQPGVGNTING